MEWWVWVLIGLAGVGVAVAKIVFLLNMKRNMEKKKKFKDEE